MTTFPVMTLVFVLSALLSGKLTQAAGCPTLTKFFDSQGVIESPGYSQSQNYPNEVTCTWQISGPSGSTVTIEFETFDLEYSKVCDVYDYLTLKESCTGQDKTFLGGRTSGYCGNDKPPKLNTTCNELFITFHSDDSDTAKGFRAKYTINKDSDGPMITCFGDSKCNSEIVANANEKFVFHCRVYGHPRPKRYWSREDGMALPVDAVDDNNGTLTIPSLRYPEDSGTYKCVANNTMGEDFKTAELIVKPKCFCPPNITMNWYHSPPFVAHEEDSEIPSGIFPILIAQVIASCCGNCSNGHGVSKLFYNTPKESLNDVKAAIGSKDIVHMSFPIAGKETDEDYKGEYYRPLFSSPGVAVLVMKEDSSESAKAILASVISAWPVLLLTLVMAWLSGIVMWALDTWYNPEEFPRPFHLGVFEGFWWAFVTMTTVGYGDRSPRGYAARIFAIGWVLVGLVVISITTGVITTSLTAITLSTDLKLYGAKVGAISNSTEYRLGVKKNCKVQDYDNLDSMFADLEKRNIKGVLLDSFVAGANKGSLSSNIRVNKILSYDSSYGIVFRGEMGSTPLQICFNNYVATKKGSISTIVEKNTSPVKEPKQSASEERASRLFDAETPMFKNALFTCLGLLFFFSACGLIWDYGYRRHFRKSGSDFDDLAMLAGHEYETVKANMELLDSLVEDVQRFNDMWSERLDETLKKHDKEYEEFTKRQAQKA